MSVKLTCEQLETCFIKSVEFIRDEIVNRSPMYKNVWNDFVPVGDFDFSKGYDRTKYTFRSSGIPQNLRWAEIEEDRPAGTLGPNDLGHNSCEYESYLVEHSLEAVTNKIFTTNIATKKFCLDSMLFTHALSDIITMFAEAFTGITLGTREKFNKKAAILNYDILIATDDRDTFLSNKFTATDLDDLPNIAGINVTPLSIDHLTDLYNFELINNGRYGLGMTDGSPDFGFISSPETIRSLYDQKPDAFDVLKRRSDNKLLDGYGFSYSRDHYIMMQDPRNNRYDETSPGSGQLLEIHQEDIRAGQFCGEGAFASETYAFNADFEISFIMYDPGAAFTINMPNPKTQFAGGMDFSPRNYTGEFNFFRPPADCGTEKRNTGWWFAEFLMEPVPGKMRGTAIIHRRCKTERYDLGFCAPCDIATCPALAAAKADVDLVGGEPTQLDIDLTGGVFSLPLTIGDLVAFELQNGDFEIGTVIDASANPVHRFVFNSDATTYATAGTNPIVDCLATGLTLCGNVCDCSQNAEGADDEIIVQLLEKTIGFGVGAVIGVDFVDASSTTATITAIGGTTTWPTYELTFASARTCDDNGGIATIGTCP